MKKILLITAAVLAIGFAACKKSDFSDAYTDPSKLAETTIEKQFDGFLTSYLWGNHDKGQRGYVVPGYWHYFVILRPLVHYTQSVGWINGDNQYVPGLASIEDRWKDYYFFVAQYRDLETVFSKLSTEEQTNKRIYMIAATIFFYDQTQKAVDLHGDIPWSDAGRLNANRTDYKQAYAKYDDAIAIYTKMLDDLKALSDELNTINVTPLVMGSFDDHDLVNNGSLTLWKKYCNSLRLRSLTRVSGVTAFQSRVNTEMAQILSNAATYPVVESNADNIKVDVFDASTDITAKWFRGGLEDGNGNVAGKVMIDHMLTNSDPRLRAMFQPGDSAKGVYTGLDPLMNRTAQAQLVNDAKIAIYNRSAISRNQFFPGILINAAEVNYLKAEYYLKASNAAAARTAYETGIQQSIEYYFRFRSISTDSSSGSFTPTNPTEINAYIMSPAVNWTLAATNTDKLNLIARQKWIHYSVIQPYESWAEVRRLNAPVFSFETDNANQLKQPPARWIYPSSELTYNTDNYNAVRSKDNLTNKVFWDVN